MLARLDCGSSCSELRIDTLYADMMSVEGVCRREETNHANDSTPTLETTALVVTSDGHRTTHKASHDVEQQVIANGDRSTT